MNLVASTHLDGTAGYEPEAREGLGASIREFARQANRAIRRHLWLALGIVGAGILLAVVATMLDTPRYTAVSTIKINDQGEQVLGEEFDAQADGSSGWDIDRFLNTQIDILRSRALALRVARALDLFDDPRFFAAMEVPVPAAGTSEAVRRELVIGKLRENLDAQLPQSTRIVQIGFTSADAEFSARIANAFAEEFIKANLQNRYESSDYARSFVAEQLEEARVQLEESERELNAYARSAGLIRTRSPEAQNGEAPVTGSVTASSLMQINQAANEARAARIAAESRWNAERATPLLSSQTVLANPTVQGLMTRRAEVEAELMAARERYLSDHPAIQRLETELASTQRQLQNTANSVRNSVRAEYLAARSAESRLAAQVSRLQSATMAEQDRSVRYNTLAREADTARSIYDGLLQRFRELNAAAGVAASNVTIIDEADPPLAPSSPNLLLNLALGLLGGLGLAALVVFFRDQFDDSVRVPEDVEAKLGLPLLGVIPKAETDDPDAELGDPKSPMTESYNSLRGALFHTTRQGLPPVMAVTSAQATEGKSTTSLALASGLARMGVRTVLVDADLRRPSLHHRFGIENEHGLAQLLTSADPAMSAVRDSGKSGLHLLPSGAIPVSASELVTSPRMAGVLEELAENFDAVVIDSPPVLGLADAPALAALADGTIFVIEAERAHSGQLKTALKRLRVVNPVLLGAVLTKFDPNRAENRYASYYGYDYYRYDRQEAQAA